MIDKTDEMKAKAVAIAQDVLARLNAGKLTLKKEAYIKPINSQFPRSGSLQDQIDTAEANCQVCALGACLLSYARLYNNVECNDFTFNCVSQTVLLMQETLYSAFTPWEMVRMEYVFERKAYEDNIDRRVYPTKKERRELRRKFEMQSYTFNGRIDLQCRLRAVCENIVANGGHFRPAVQPTVG